MERNEVEVEVGKTVSAMSALYQSMATIFTDDQRHRTTARSLLLAVSVWMPLEVYYQWPVMLPWIVRKNNLGGHPKGFADPNTGLQWQDNSPVGTLKNGVPVEWAAKGPTFKSKSLRSATQEWWQAHVWDGMTTDPLTNSFAPNLVWLPEAIGRLTDADTTGTKSTLFQEEIKTIAWALYRDAPVHPKLHETVERIWARIPEPATLPLDIEDHAAVNWFKATAAFQKRLVAKHSVVWGAVNELIDTGVLVENQVTPGSYRKSLRDATPRGLANLRRILEPFAAAAEDYVPPSLTAAASTVSKAGTSTSKAKTTYIVRTAAGEKAIQARSLAALQVVRSALECGVPTSAVKNVIKAKLTIVPGEVFGDQLLQAMIDAGAAGVPKSWYVASPVRVGSDTCVVNSQSWYESDEKLLAQLAGLTDGQVEFEVKAPTPSADAVAKREETR